MSPKRRIKDLKRRRAFKTPNKPELIVCEGSSTEPSYFRAFRGQLRLYAVQVDVVGLLCQSRPIQVVDHAIFKKKSALRQSLPYNKVWCVIDVEAPVPHESLTQAIAKARDNKINVILSNPCFEYWFLLHFKKTITAFPNDTTVYNSLKQVHKSYKKTRIGFDILFPRTHTAIKHAQEVLLETNCGEDLTHHNPSTHVHRLVTHLQQISST